MSAMWYASIPGVTAIPSNPGIRFMTRPPAGAVTVRVRKISPVSSSRAICSGEMSQNASRARAASTRASARSRASSGASRKRPAYRIAERSSCSVCTSSGE